MTWTRKTWIVLLVGAALAAGPGCSDRGQGPAGGGAESDPASARVTESDLAGVDRLLGELDRELKAYEAELTTTDEGDLTQ